MMLVTGRSVEAADVLSRALALRPDNSDTSLALANALTQAGNHGRAIAQYRRVLAQQPGRIDALVNLARALCLAGDPHEAACCCRAALVSTPGFAPARMALAAALLQAGDPSEALAAADLVLSADQQAAEAWFVRGTALTALARPEAAAAALRHAIALRPSDSRSWMNLGNALADTDALTASEQHLRQAVALDPMLAEAHASLGFVLASLGQLSQSVASCDTAIRLRPQFARAFWNRSFAHLLAGDFAAGWEDYEWRRHDPQFATGMARLPGAEWQGGPLGGRHLLVLASQGLGDTIQFARFLPELAQRASRVTLACAASLVPLLRQLPVSVIDRDTPLPPHDLWVDQMSLPRLLGTRPGNIPAPGGYLSDENASGLGDGTGRLRVGVVWAGNPAHSNDTRRSMPLDALAPLLSRPEIACTSLQVGPQAARIEARFGIPDNSRELDDFAATARLIGRLDLVLAVYTATAHLAAALGKPVWIMLPFAPDWRWMTDRDDSPWYASARLFRQCSPGDWDGVVRRVLAALLSLAEQVGHRPPARSYPASWRRIAPAL